MTKLLMMTKVPHVDLLIQGSKSEFHNLFPVFNRKTCKQTLHVCPEQYETELQPVTGQSVTNYNTLVLQQQSAMRMEQAVRVAKP